SKGHIQVCLRVRPFTSSERENESQDCVSFEDSKSIIMKPPKNSWSRLSEKTTGQKFTFSQVFGPETTQEEFFEGTVKQPVQDFLDGYNRLIFTYGVTNAGKTYTFQGTEVDGGILPRTMDLVFKTIQGKLYTAMDLKPHRCRDYIKLNKEQVREESAIKNSVLRLTKECFVKGCYSTNFDLFTFFQEINLNRLIFTCNILCLADLEEFLQEPSSTTVNNYPKFSVWISFFEIYNECFYDLLSPTSNDKKRKPLRLAQDIKGCSYVRDLQWIQIFNSKEAVRLLQLGLKYQSTASTKQNVCSSRSHRVFTVKMLKIEDAGTPRVVQVNELTMCDLAGSERWTKTRNEGDRLKESGNINTSLLILGKCINALKNCQQSKLQQHIPFRESKLTHFLQGFFSGKGKVYMIVNISQCASAYDETLNVLKFSAIAQKVLVMDTSVLPQDQLFGQKSASESLPGYAKMPIPRKRATVLWDRSLEDVIEDDGDEMEEQYTTSTEKAVQQHEEVILKKEEYMVCAKDISRISLIGLLETLKDKLITEKKDKALLELKIREEVTREFTKYFAEREINFKEHLSYEREQLEENSERRLEIFKELINGCTESEDEKSRLECQPCKYVTGSGTCVDFEGIITSLQNDVVDIKKQAEVVHSYFASVEDPHEAIVWLEKQLGKVTAELTKTREDLTKKTSELLKTEEDLTRKNKVKSSQFEDCEETPLEMGRKRCFENKPTVEEPPAKKDDSLEQKRTEYVKRNNPENNEEILMLKERIKTLECQLAALEDECRREKAKNEEFSGQITNLHLKISVSEERASSLSEDLQQCRADYQDVVSELDKQKNTNKKQEEQIVQLNNEVECAKRSIIDKVSKIRTMQSKVDELYKGHLESYAMDVDVVNLKDPVESQKDESHTIQMNPACMQSQSAATADPRRECSFHCSVESIWEECKNIIKASSQKSHQIQELLQQIGDLKKRLDDTENCNNELKLKLNEMENQSIKEKDLMSQLQEQIQKNQAFEKQAAEDHRVIARFEEEIASYKGKIRELECLLETFRAKNVSITKLEEALHEKESIILSAENNAEFLQEKCADLDRKLKELNDQEANWKGEVLQLTNSLENMKQSLQEKERTEHEQTQSVALLHKDLSESSALVQNLKKDLQRKEEEYMDLKEKFSDAKKQIQQVQKEVCTMRSEEKALRDKINELQKAKSNLSEQLETKQRTILQLQKQLNNEKLKEVSKQYEKTCKDLRAKEKIIEDMRMTLKEQEQTQIEQDQVLEAKLEENNVLVQELEAWKQKYGELNNQSDSNFQPTSKNEEKNVNGNKELIKLQRELEENQAKYQTDRTKWLEERMRLVNQVKEAESHRNREIRNFAEGRKHHAEQQAEIERLNAQLIEKESNLEKWREERDELVEALEIQLKTLASNMIQKDKEITELKQAAVKDSGQQKLNCGCLQSLAEVPLPEDEIDQSVKKEDHSEIVLDSSEVSTESGKTSRFPKPEMEIQFTPLKPNKMEVKHQGSTLPLTVKTIKPRKKRKSEDMDEDFVKNENKKNARPAMMNSPSTSNKKMTSYRKEYSLRKQESTSSIKSSKKKDGTLQKIGDFFQSSPTIFHSKAKKLMATISSPKSAEAEGVKETRLKPKRAKRKLYTTDISCPIDIPASSIFVEKEEKESDHQIIKRRLRSKQAK
ncbi:KI20B protein, partial [Psilopogon haemacephalus]|nr:KI20B protein [Psilopogon haemacephalus]